MAGLKAVLFDNDGTLVDSRELLLASFHYAGPAVLGRQLSDEEYLQKVGQPLAVQVKDYTEDPVLQERFCEAYRAHNKTVHDKMIKAFPGTVEALAKLAGVGLRLGVVTSKRHAVAWRGLEVVGAASYLDCCVGWDDIERPKPDPQPVVRGCELLGFDPSDCLYVGLCFKKCVLRDYSLPVSRGHMELLPDDPRSVLVRSAVLSLRFARHCGEQPVHIVVCWHDA